MSDQDAIREWQLAHEELLQKERHLAQQAVRHAKGELSIEELESFRTEIAVLRERVDQLFDAAFENWPRDPQGLSARPAGSTSPDSPSPRAGRG